MPRIARQGSKSGTYHVLFHGNNKLKDIFIDELILQGSKAGIDIRIKAKL